jgi:hypothetical protein
MVVLAPALRPEKARGGCVLEHKGAILEIAGHEIAGKITP